MSRGNVDCECGSDKGNIGQIGDQSHSQTDNSECARKKKDADAEGNLLS